MASALGSLGGDLEKTAERRSWSRLPYVTSCVSACLQVYSGLREQPGLLKEPRFQARQALAFYGILAIASSNASHTPLPITDAPSAAACQAAPDDRCALQRSPARSLGSAAPPPSHGYDASARAPGRAATCRCRARRPPRHLAANSSARPSCASSLARPTNLVKPRDVRLEVGAERTGRQARQPLAMRSAPSPHRTEGLRSDEVLAQRQRCRREQVVPGLSSCSIRPARWVVWPTAV